MGLNVLKAVKVINCLFFCGCRKKKTGEQARRDDSGARTAHHLGLPTATLDDQVTRTPGLPIAATFLRSKRLPISGALPNLGDPELMMCMLDFPQIRLGSGRDVLVVMRVHIVRRFCCGGLP